MLHSNTTGKLNNNTILEEIIAINTTMIFHNNICIMYITFVLCIVIITIFDKEVDIKQRLNMIEIFLLPV